MDEQHQVDLRRPAYYYPLMREARDVAGIVVVGDTFSMPGALPLMMGMTFVLLKTPYTPAWVEDFVSRDEGGEVLGDLGLLVGCLDRRQP